MAAPVSGGGFTQGGHDYAYDRGQWLKNFPHSENMYQDVYARLGFLANPRKDSHREFLNQRDWDAVTDLVRSVVRGESNQETLDTLMRSAPGEDVGLLSTRTTDPRNPDKKTFFIEHAYYGKAFRGWQKQPKFDANTVQQWLTDPIEALLRDKAYCFAVAGRTDKGVSALHQVASFNTYEDVSAAQVQAALDAAHPDLRALRVVQVERRWHATWSAQRRRYIYLLPLNPVRDMVAAGGGGGSGGNSTGGSSGHGRVDGDDIDVAALDAVLRELEGKTLPCDAFAVGECRVVPAAARVVDPRKPSKSDLVAFVRARAERRVLQGRPYAMIELQVPAPPVRHPLFQHTNAPNAPTHQCTNAPAPTHRHRHTPTHQHTNTYTHQHNMPRHLFKRLRKRLCKTTA
jgi:tRNA pseudouridine(38-40) synthase